MRARSSQRNSGSLGCFEFGSRGARERRVRAQDPHLNLSYFVAYSLTWASINFTFFASDHLTRSFPGIDTRFGCEKDWEKFIFIRWKWAEIFSCDQELNGKSVLDVRRLQIYTNYQLLRFWEIKDMLFEEKWGILATKRMDITLSFRKKKKSNIYYCPQGFACGNTVHFWQLPI